MKLTINEGILHWQPPFCHTYEVSVEVRTVHVLVDFVMAVHTDVCRLESLLAVDQTDLIV